MVLPALGSIRVTDRLRRTQPTEPDQDRRDPTDRRDEPTPMLSRFTLRGKRSRIRRDFDLERGRYVDRSRGRYLGLILVLIVFIAIDALSTLYIIAQGGTEANPIMDSTLELGVGWFLLVKLGPLPAAFILLSVHRYYRWVRFALFALAAIYTTLMLYHISLLLKIH